MYLCSTSTLYLEKYMIIINAKRVIYVDTDTVLN